MTELKIENKRLLVVEDDPAIRSLVAMRLGVQGFDVREAKDGVGALDRLRDFRPQAMILDINMPKLDGFGVMSHVGLAGMARMPTLVLTARHNADDVKLAVAMGARDYLAKPFDDAQLFARVARLFRRAPGARVAAAA